MGGDAETGDQITGFGEDNLAASLTDSQLYRNVQGVEAQIPVVMDRAGDILGIAVASSEARTGGTATFEVYKNGVATGLTVTLDGTNTQYNSATQAAGTDSYVAGDRLDVRVTTDGTWAPTTADVEAVIIVGGESAGGGGGGGAWTFIETQEITGAAGMIEFTAIPSTYEALLIVFMCRAAGNGTSGDDMWVRCGDGAFDSGPSDYGYVQRREGTTAGTASDGADSEMVLATMPSDGHDDGDFGSYQMLVTGYKDTSKVTNFVLQGGFMLQDGSVIRTHTATGTHLNDTVAIDQIQIRSGATVSGTGDLEIGSIAYLFGLEAS